MAKKHKSPGVSQPRGPSVLISPLLKELIEERLQERKRADPEHRGSIVKVAASSRLRSDREAASQWAAYRALQGKRITLGKLRAFLLELGIGAPEEEELDQWVAMCLELHASATPDLLAEIVHTIESNIKAARARSHLRSQIEEPPSTRRH